MGDIDVSSTQDVMSELESGKVYREGRRFPLQSGSRAEELTLEGDWGHEGADEDVMWLYGERLGVHVAGGQQPRGTSCLEFRPEGCPAGYCKLEISDLQVWNESRKVFDDSCIEKSGSMTCLNTYNAVRCMADSFSFTRGDPVSGPAAQGGTLNTDTVNTLVCSGPHPDFHHEFRRRTRGPWPTAAVINYLLQLPMMLVLVGHKLSPEFNIQARMSWSYLEYALIKELPESVRQGYIACKNVMKCFLKVRRGQNEAGDGRSNLCSYHIKTVFLRFLEKRPPSLITSPFGLFLAIFRELDEYMKVGKLPHYFLAECDLLETIGDDERHLVRQVIGVILSDPLNALLTSPSRPQQIYGKVRPDHLVSAFQRVSNHPTCKQSRKDLSKLLARVDERRRERFREQQKRDKRKSVGWHKMTKRTELTGLVAMLKQIKQM